jgi:hypothetical protein
LLVQQSDDTLSRILVNDLSRQLGNYLDQAALYGQGSAANQPARLVSYDRRSSLELYGA